MNNTDNSYFELKRHVTNDMPFKLYEGELSAYRDCYIHWHREFEIIYVVSGHTRVTINNKVFHGTTGDLIFVNKKAIYFIERMDWDKNIFKYKTLVFDLGYIDGKCSIQEKYIHPLLEKTNIFDNFITSKDNNYEHIREIYLELAEECKKKDRYSDIKVSTHVLRLIEKMYESGYVKQNNDTFVENERAVKQAIAFINSHYGEELNNKAIAGIAGFSEGYFIHVFKKYTGKSVMDYLLDVRINYAVEKA